MTEMITAEKTVQCTFCNDYQHPHYTSTPPNYCTSHQWDFYFIKPLTSYWLMFKLRTQFHEQQTQFMPTRNMVIGTTVCAWAVKI